MNNKVMIGEAVRSLREDHGCTQKMVRDVLGLKKSNYSDIETGKRILNASELIALLEHFGVSLDMFLNYIKINSTQVKPCYICGDKHSAKDKYHHNRCLKCKREQSRFYCSESTQRALEKKALNGERDVYLCECGNYFVSINKRHDKCKSCLKNK